MKHPQQPIYTDDDGVERFRTNPIITRLLSRSGVTMNDLAVMGFSDEDQAQFAQLIGYSVGGYEELSYTDDVVICNKPDDLPAIMNRFRLLTAHELVARQMLDDIPESYIERSLTREMVTHLAEAVTFTKGEPDESFPYMVKFRADIMVMNISDFALLRTMIKNLQREASARQPTTPSAGT